MIEFNALLSNLIHFINAGIGKNPIVKQPENYKVCPYLSLYKLYRQSL